MARKNTPADFWRLVDYDGPLFRGEPCWLWRGNIDPSLGYGRFFVDMERHFAHRFSFEFHRGKPADGMTLDHLCRVRHCVNPNHLEVVTSVENVMRGEGICARNARKTMCKNGHPFSDENTRTRKEGYRRCHICMVEVVRRCRQNKRIQRAILDRKLDEAHRKESQ